MSRRNKGRDPIRFYASSVGRTLCKATGVHRSGRHPRAIGTDHELSDLDGAVVLGWIESATARQWGPDLWLYEIEYRPNPNYSHPLWCSLFYRIPHLEPAVVPEVPVVAEAAMQEVTESPVTNGAAKRKRRKRELVEQT